MQQARRTRAEERKRARRSSVFRRDGLCIWNDPGAVYINIKTPVEYPAPADGAMKRIAHQERSFPSFISATKL